MSEIVELTAPDVVWTRQVHHHRGFDDMSVDAQMHLLSDTFRAKDTPGQRDASRECDQPHPSRFVVFDEKLVAAEVMGSHV